MFDSGKSLPSRRRRKQSKRVTTATLGEWVTSLVFCSYEKKNYKYIFHNNRLMQTYLSKINCSCLIVTVHCNSQYVFLLHIFHKLLFVSTWKASFGFKNVALWSCRKGISLKRENIPRKF